MLTADQLIDLLNRMEKAGCNMEQTYLQILNDANDETCDILGATFEIDSPHDDNETWTLKLWASRNFSQQEALPEDE